MCSCGCLVFTHSSLMATSSPVAMLAPEETRAEIPTAVKTIAPLHVRGPKTNEHKGKSEFSARIKEEKKKKKKEWHSLKREALHTLMWKEPHRAESWVKRLRTEEKKKRKKKVDASTYRGKCLQKNHSLSFARAGTCSQLSAPCFQLVTVTVGKHRY